MAKCIECGVEVRAGESFCGACGTHQPEVAQASASIADLPMGGDTEQETLENVVVEKPNQQTGELSRPRRQALNLTS